MTDFLHCPHWGKGGRYQVNPQTGERTPVGAESPALSDVAQAAPVPAADAPSKSQKTKPHKGE